MSKKIAVVGTGASSMYAVLACNDLGISPDLVTNPRGLKVQPGAFWLKWLPQNLSKHFDLFNIRMDSVGTREEYIRKQWKLNPKGYLSSFPEKTKYETGFNPYEVIQTIYGEIDRYRLMEHSRGYLLDDDLFTMGKHYDLVFHSFPTQKAKEVNQDLFVSIPVEVSDSSFPSNFTVYDGTENTEIVRVSYLFGYKFTEYPYYTNPAPSNGGTVVRVGDLKPFGEKPNFFQISENVIPIGRFGRMDSSLLSHDAYNFVRGMVENL